MPSLSSLSLLRLPRRPLLPPPPLLLLPRRRLTSLIPLSSQNPNPNPRANPPPSKHLLRARDSLRSLSSLSLTSLSSLDPRRLVPSQAIGLVAASQANFMRVIVETPGGPNPNPSPFSPDPRVGTELLCVVRALLKKIGRRVLVGDRVLVGSLDWNGGRGMIEDVFERKAEVLDPPVANVDHLLVMFAMDQPRPEPFTLTRFLVEAESMEIPFTLAMNKAELAGEEVVK